MPISLILVFAIFCYLTQEAYLQDTLKENDVLSPTQTYNCDFETNFCSFLFKDPSSQEEWQIGKGKTSPADTGPSVDHTLGNANGSYLYVASRNTSRIFLRFYTGILKRDACIQFFYHMYGASVGTLTVALKEGKEEKDTYFERRGTQGDRWKETAISITPTASMKRTGYRILFKVMQKFNIDEKGIIAFDDIVLKPGKCENDNKNASLLCSFDGGNCSYSSVEKNDLVWQWNKMGREILDDANPESDHTLGTRKGGYWSSGVKNSFFASKTSTDLTTPLYTLPEISVSCLQFYYYIDGDSSSWIWKSVKEANLNVYVVTTKPHPFKYHLMSKSKNITHHREWTYAEIPLYINVPFQIQFNAELESSVQALIAIDDVKVLPGECPETGSCDFEDDKCLWIDGDSDTVWKRRHGEFLGIGPNSDHTRNDKTGFYVIIRGDNSTHNESFTADLISTTFPPRDEEFCLTFFFFINTEDDEKLMVIRTEGNTTRSVIWIKGKMQSTSWRKGMVPLLPSRSSTQVTFRGISGRNPDSYIALDDIRIRKGEECNISPSDMDLRLCPYASDPCGKNGNCSWGGDTYKCNCESPFFGRSCEYSPCTSDPCGSNGKCSLDGDTYKCDCETPFFGWSCEYSPCTSDPCENNGNCSLDGYTYKCDCETPFFGRSCEYSPCTSDPCENNGNCSLDGDTYKCDCETPFFGRSCEYSPCTSDPCENNGNCSLDGDTYKCDCETPFFGRSCEYSPCTSDPCGNNGNCSLDGDTYKCDCESPFFGKSCESVVTTTLPTSTKVIASCFRHSDCQNGGFCDFERGGECLCRTGTTGKLCQEVPVCQKMVPFCRATCGFDLDLDEAICDCGGGRKPRFGHCKGTGDDARIYAIVLLCLLSVLIVVNLIFVVVSCLSLKKK